MFRFYLALILAVEIAALLTLKAVAPDAPVLLLAPLVPLTLVAAILLRRRFEGPSYRTRRLSP